VSKKPKPKPDTDTQDDIPDPKAKPCPTGQTRVAGKCQNPTCTTGTKLVKGKCEAITCGTGKHLVGSSCKTIDCPAGQKLKGSTCEDIDCGSGKELVGTSCKPVCKTGLVRSGTSCKDNGEACPDGSPKHPTKGCGYTSMGTRFVNMSGTVFNSSFMAVLGPAFIAAGSIYLQDKYLPPGGLQGIKDSLENSKVNIENELVEWKTSVETPGAWLGDVSSIAPNPDLTDESAIDPATEDIIDESNIAEDE
jgi:hypothetical protein